MPQPATATLPMPASSWFAILAVLALLAISVLIGQFMLNDDVTHKVANVRQTYTLHSVIDNLSSTGGQQFGDSPAEESVSRCIAVVPTSDPPRGAR